MLEYHLLKELQTNPAHTQRSLAAALKVSLGKAHYLLSGLMHKGLIRARKLKHHPQGIRWHYLLTPEGLQEKLRLTRAYLQAREGEYAMMRSEIDALRQEVQQQEEHAS